MICLEEGEAYGEKRAHSFFFITTFGSTQHIPSPKGLEYTPH